MRIFVKAKPGARQAFVEKIDNANFVVAVREPPKEGRANMAIAKALEEYFHRPVHWFLVSPPAKKFLKSQTNIVRHCLTPCVKGCRKKEVQKLSRERRKRGGFHE